LRPKDLEVLEVDVGREGELLQKYPPWESKIFLG